MRVLFGDEVKRSFQYRGGQDAGCDVLGTPFSIEAKTGVKIDWPKAFEQSLRDSQAADGKPPIVVGHYTGGRSLVMMEMETFIAMVVSLCHSNPPDPEKVKDDLQRVLAYVAGSEDFILPEVPGEVQRLPAGNWKAFLPGKECIPPDRTKRPRKRGNPPGGCPAR